MTFSNKNLPAFSRRELLLITMGAAAAMAEDNLAERIGVIVILPSDESGARHVLAAAREAGFRHTQVIFNWIEVTKPFLSNLPRWMREADLEADALGAYVNCVAPEVVIMGTRLQDLDRAIGYAPEIGARRLTAWTGGYGSGLFVSDPRNFSPNARQAILRTLEPHYRRLEANRLKLCLESYITLACPDAPALRKLLDAAPPCIDIVFDPPNLTPIRRYAERDQVLREMAALLRDRAGIVHCKDFRLASDGQHYDLPGPLDGVMNYPLFFELIRTFPADTPIVAEHMKPDAFKAKHTQLLSVLKHS